MNDRRPRPTSVASRLSGLAAAFVIALVLVRMASAQADVEPDKPAPRPAPAPPPPSTPTPAPSTPTPTPTPAPAPSPAQAGTPDSLAFAPPDTGLVRDTTGHVQRSEATGDSVGFTPREIPSAAADSAAAARNRPAGKPLDRSAWILWTPRVADFSIPRWQWYDSLFFASEPAQLRYPIDARAVKVAVDPEKGTVTTSLEAADVPLAPAREVPFDAYVKDLTSTSLRRAWVDASRQRIRNVPANADLTGGPGLKFEVPVELPKAAESILGKGGPSLAVSGSERISIAGTSNWDNRGASGIGVSNSLFPQLDMRQDLDIRLDGSLGDKVNVDVAQNSANTVPLSNRIGIRYKGYEDEVITNLDLGNTNLSMPGTQYVSYSGRNEGLFGAKAAMKLGGTDVALIASKQEGRSERKTFQGTAQEVIRQVDDTQYIKGKYFFLQRPAEQLQTNSTIEIGTLRVFIDDRNGSNDQGLRRGTAEVDPTTATPDTLRSLNGVFDGLRELDDYTVSTEYYGERFPVLVLKNAISNSSVLAVTYDETLPGGTLRHVGSVPDCPGDPTQCQPMRLKMIQATRDRLIADASGDFFETDPVRSPFYVTRDYEIKSFYDLQTRNIDPKSITIQIRRYSSTLDESNDAYRESGQSYPYLQILGADLFNDNGSGAASPGADQLVDQFVNADYLRAEEGVLFFPDLRPFDPRVDGRPDATPEEEYFFKPRIESDPTIPGLRRRILWPAGTQNPPGMTPGSITPVELESNPNVYDKRNLQVVADRRYYIYAKFTGADYSGTISLGQTNLLEGSEVIAIEGLPLERNKDYTIDYEAGIVTLLSVKAREARSRLTIDYSFAPLFAQAGRTLVGSTASYRSNDLGFGGAFIYEAKGQQEARPRLGEEPSRTLIGDLSTQFVLKPQFLTNLVDRLPFYSTTEESRIGVNGEIGISMPNPNTQNTVYIDDFEGNRDSYSAPMSRGYWKWPAPPLVASGAAVDTVQADYSELIWYNPYNTVEAGDLNPKLTRNEGRENIVTALDFYIPKEPAVREHGSLWAGITTTVEPDGTDFSRMQFLELWVNDWRDPDVRNNPNLKLHVDLGILSEDQQRAPGVPPNGIFDTEDKNADNKYDPPAGDPAKFENGGADGIPDELETDTYDLSTATETDKHGDDYFRSPVDLSSESNSIERFNPRNYVGPTLSEKSKGTYESGNALFSEDLNGNQNLDNGLDANVYVSYTLPIGDSLALKPFIIYDSYSVGTDINNEPIPESNGWRRFRIPLDIANSDIRKVVRNGSLSTVKHMRVWLEGIQTFKGDATAPKTSPTASGRQPLIELAAVDVVGNRWRIAETDSGSGADGSIVARNVNNQEDRTIYTPPFEVETQSRGGSSQTQREQSLALEVANLPAGKAATIFKDQTLAEDYTRYSRLGFYTAQFGFTNDDQARLFLRIGYDDRNYYEYSRPIRDASSAPFAPTPWQTVAFDLTQLTNVKLHRSAGVEADSIEVPGTGERYKVVGSPTFTRTQRLTLGVYSENPDSTRRMSGQIWIDDLRALDVDRSRGVANRITIDTKLADLMTFTTNWDRTDQNFQRLGQSRASDANNDRLAFAGTFAPQRLMGTSGIMLPLTFAWSKNSSTPRLRTGTDVFLEGADAQNEKSEFTDRSFGVNFSKTGDRNPILRNTVGRTSLNFSFADHVGHTPTSVDSTRTLAGGGAYSISPAEWFKVPIPIWKARGQVQKFQPLPQTFTISYGQSTTRTFAYRRGLEDPVGQYALQSDIYRKSALYQLAGNWRPLTFGSYSFTATRNANIPNITPARILGINFGRMTNFGQRLDARFTVPTRTFFRPALDFATTYGEARTPDLSPDLSLGAFQNGTNAGMNFELPFAKLAVRRTQAPPSAPPRPFAPGDSTRRDTTRVVAPPPPGFAFGTAIGNALARLGTVSVRGSFSRTTAYARYLGVPSVPYRLGLVRDPNTQWNGEEVTSIYRGPQATFNAQRTYSGEASTAVALYGRTTARIRGSYTNTNRLYNAQVSNNETVAFPDLQFDWGSMTRVLRLGSVFSALNAQSRFSKTLTTEGPSLSNPQSKVSATNYQPLLSLTGTTKGTAQVLVTVDRQSSTREDFLIRRSVRKEDVTNIRGSISRSYLPGQKLPIFGGSGLKSTLTLQLDGSYNTRGGSTEAGGVVSSRTDTKGIQMNSSGTYSFSSYVYGTVTLGFTQNKDNQNRTLENKPIVSRSLRLEGAATIRF